jgi:pimeloyl-ACP methyl ester carboxylesterase
MSTVTSPDGTVIDYDRYGDGPAVIIIGGATAYRAIDEGTTQTARRLAAERYTAIDYERHGRGRSGDTPPSALDREVEDVAELIKAAGGAALCTNSSGADIALAAAAGAGVTALVLYEPPFFAGRSLWDRMRRIDVRSDGCRLPLERLAGYSCHRYACELTASLPSAEMPHSGNSHDHFGNVMLPQLRIRPLRRDLPFRCQRPGLR